MMNNRDRSDQSQEALGISCFDISWITESLAVSGGIEETRVDELRVEHQVSAVVDLRAESQDSAELMKSRQIRFLYLPAADCCALSVEKMREGVLWIQEALRRGEKVLVHCQHGIGRSPMLVAAVLIADGATPENALLRIKRARPKVCPSYEQLEALRSFYEIWSLDKGIQRRAIDLLILRRIGEGFR